MFTRKIFKSILVTTLTMASTIAAAQTASTSPRPQGRAFITQNGNAPKVDYDFTPYVGTLGEGGASFGVLGSYRLAPKGFIPVINNSVAVEGGVNSGILCADSHCQGLMNVSAHLRWEFHVHPQWTAYVAPGAAVGEVLTRFGTDVKHGLFVSPKIGAFWWLSESNALRLEYDDNLNSHRIGYMFVF